MLTLFIHYAYTKKQGWLIWSLIELIPASTPTLGHGKCLWCFLSSFGHD